MLSGSCCTSSSMTSSQYKVEEELLSLRRQAGELALDSAASRAGCRTHKCLGGTREMSLFSLRSSACHESRMCVVNTQHAAAVETLLAAVVLSATGGHWVAITHISSSVACLRSSAW
jgi:hypothetical protein